MKYPRLETMLIRTTAAVCAGAAALSLAACGAGGGTANGQPEGDVTIGISFWGPDSRVRLTQQVIDGFEKEHPNIHVEEQYSDWSGYWDKLATQVAGNNAPDVLSIDEMYLASYASQGILADLSAYSDTIDVSQFDQSLVDMGKIDGTWYGIANSLQAYAVTVNKDLLAQYGFELPDTSTWTWDDFKAFAKEVYRKSDGKVIGAFPMRNAYGLQLWARQHGESLFDGDKVAISPELLTEFLNMPAQWAKEGLYDFNV
ncbi:ABC transporter substrate-binding protein [Bifidobacterium avesanii]|nr:ABC transporter substrate-binding protein [Bifidobacterium avesanii]